MIEHRTHALRIVIIVVTACAAACVAVRSAARLPAVMAAPQPSRSAQVDVNTGMVFGCCETPGASLSISWRSANEREKRAVDIHADSNGRYAVRPGIDVVEGDVVAVFFDPGDPQIVPILRLTGVPDENADEVGGLAPPGADVTVQITRDKQGVLAERRTNADSAGRYKVSFAGTHDIVPGNGGALVAELPGGGALVSAWVAQSVTLEQGEPDLIKFLAPEGMAPECRMLGADDRPIAVGQPISPYGWTGTTAMSSLGPVDQVGGAVIEILAYLRDPLGADVDIHAGDIAQIRLPASDDVTRWTLPPLEAAFFVDEDRVTGITRPNHVVTLSVNKYSPWVESAHGFSATSDAGGRFTFDLAGTFDMAYQDGIMLEVGDPGRLLRRHVTTPGLTLDLDSGHLTGSMAPYGQVLVTATSQGRERFRARVLSKSDGAFTAWLVDAAGAPLALSAGDAVTIQQLGQPAAKAVPLILPELSVTLDPTADVVTGRASPDGRLWAEVASIAFPHPGAVGQPVGTGGGRVTIDPDGAWSMPIAGLAPGARATITFRLPVGHIVTMRRFAPLLAAEVGGARLCGIAATPHQPVSAALTANGGTTRATADGVTDARSAFDLLWRFEGVAVASLPGQVARADLGGASPVEVPLADLTATMDWRSYDLTVHGPPNAIGGTRLGPSSACRSLLDDPPSTEFLYLDGNGLATTRRLPDLLKSPGTGVTVWVYLPDGHVLFRHLPRPTAYLYPDTDRVTGWAEAGQPVTVVQLAADGTELGRAATVAAEDERFEARLTANGRPSRLVAGQVVRLLVAGGLTEDVPVSTLDLDWSIGDPVIGRAEPGAAVQIELALADGRHLSLSRVADANGRFGFGALDVPPRADWNYGAIAAVRVWVPVLSWHRVVVETPGFDTPRSRPPAVRGENMLFLPRLFQPRR